MSHNYFGVDPQRKSSIELYEIAEQMVEQMGVAAFLHEVVTGMSRDEFEDTLKHVDRHCFSNHYF